MLKALVDTSTYLDIRRAPKHRRPAWAQNTLRNLLAYRAIHPKLTISVFTAYEILDGLYRGPVPTTPQEFLPHIMPAYEVIYPDKTVVALAAEINARLAKLGQGIGMGDTMIAATAISRKLTLVNANTRHFPRVQAAGFPVTLENWRDA